jgi:hypothetical protein
MTESMQRNEDGTLPAYTWPGCYPIVYLTESGLTICPTCAGESDTSDPVAGSGVHWEGEPLQCEDCGKDIESAYGIPEN